tara:strand:+ start:48 stop:929 length:882 start_codon:yes stop_codon:yes gene_type:complete
VFYKLYNHTIKIPSDLDYLGIVRDKNIIPVDIEIKFYDKANKKKNLVNNQFEIKPNYGFYYREKIGFFEFLDGEVINILLEGEADTTFFQTLFNFPFACIFAQKGFLPIHGSAVRFREKTILFPGFTKQGKSSLAATLIKLGGKLITEDIALFRLTQNKETLLPSYPLIKLSKEVNDEISFSSKEPFKLTKSDLQRDLYKLDRKDFYNQESKVDIVIFPEWSEVEELKSITHKQAVIKLISSNFFISELPSLEINSLKNNLAAIQNAKCFEFKRKKQLRNIKNFQKLIEEIFI